MYHSFILAILWVIFFLMIIYVVQEYSKDRDKRLLCFGCFPVMYLLYFVILICGILGLSLFTYTIHSRSVNGVYKHNTKDLGVYYVSVIFLLFILSCHMFDHKAKYSEAIGLVILMIGALIFVW